jgi:hypothetical protein
MSEALFLALLHGGACAAVIVGGAAAFARGHMLPGLAVVVAGVVAALNLGGQL